MSFKKKKKLWFSLWGGTGKAQREPTRPFIRAKCGPGVFYIISDGAGGKPRIGRATRHRCRCEGALGLIISRVFGSLGIVGRLEKPNAQIKRVRIPEKDFVTSHPRWVTNIPRRSTGYNIALVNNHLRILRSHLPAQGL
ncbi:hypothetical protein DQ04_07361030 [Trypanosoma grayi]|uniref:hypothetical protein n=1 Tax=Trypanosoma grayi TaxID=71804 RepID=UPI0004F437AD|nr:hypothetical protein DQ04_07361030 [Trypanosoma grayi]KEG08366.1 hypothetical protein DQ04_07361030 [Trypanosoma grayi]